MPQVPANIEERVEAVRRWAHAAAAGVTGPDMERANVEVAAAVRRAGRDWRFEWPRDPHAIARRIAMEDKGFGLEGWIAIVIILAIAVAVTFLAIALMLPVTRKAIEGAGDTFTTWMLLGVAGVALWVFGGRR